MGKPSINSGRSKAFQRFVWFKPATYDSLDLQSALGVTELELLELIDQVAEDRAKNKKLPIITTSWSDRGKFSNYEVTIVRP